MHKFLTKKTGEEAILDIDKIERVIRLRSEGIPNIDGSKILEYIKNNIFNKMTTSDVENLFIMGATSYVEEAPEYSFLAARFLLQKIYKEAFGVSTKNVDREDIYRDSFVKYLHWGVSARILDERLLVRFDLNRLKMHLEIDRDHIFEYRGLQTLYESYLITDDDKRLEAPQMFWMRVAMGLAIDEDNPTSVALQFYDEMSQLKVVPSTPTLLHSGLVQSQLSSCYLNSVEDDLHDIYKVYGDNARLAKYSGGIGTDWTNVRATNSWISGIRSGSQGIIPFIKIASDSTLAIARSGKRRGAAAVYIEVWHLDVEDFIDLRRKQGDERRRTRDLYTALWVCDLFMERVRNDEDFTLFDPAEFPYLHELYGAEFNEAYLNAEKLVLEKRVKLHKTVKAKKLWQKIIISLKETGGPWVTWKDPSNERSTQKHAGVIHNSNLCTEILEPNSQKETAVCNLASINLSKFFRNIKSVDELFEGIHQLENSVKISVRMLDNVIDINFYPTEESRVSNQRHRYIGLGVMGWQDLLYSQNVNFDSNQAELLADFIQEYISYKAIEASSELASERGSYSSFNGSSWDLGEFPYDTRKDTDLLDLSAKHFDWESLRYKVAQNGMRNAMLLAIAPTATISNISGCFPSIEPPYSNIYTKQNRIGEFTVINKYLVDDLRNIGLWTDKIREDIKRGNGSIQSIREIPKHLREKYKTAFEIDPKAAIRQTALRAKWIDQSQSHNIFYDGNSGKMISDIYFYAWDLGLKTTYYWRTKGETDIEKSTLSIQPSVCSIDNPDCESCQ